MNNNGVSLYLVKCKNYDAYFIKPKDNFDAVEFAAIYDSNGEIESVCFDYLAFDEIYCPKEISVIDLPIEFLESKIFTSVLTVASLRFDTKTSYGNNFTWNFLSYLTERIGLDIDDSMTIEDFHNDFGGISLCQLLDEYCRDEEIDRTNVYPIYDFILK